MPNGLKEGVDTPALQRNIKRGVDGMQRAMWITPNLKTSFGKAPYSLYQFSTNPQKYSGISLKYYMLLIGIYGRD